MSCGSRVCLTPLSGGRAKASATSIARPARCRATHSGTRCNGDAGKVRDPWLDRLGAPLVRGVTLAGCDVVAEHVRSVCADRRAEGRERTNDGLVETSAVEGRSDGLKR